jgi:hypothetical protein
VTRLGGAGSQRAAQQETLPLPERRVHVGGAGATGATSRGTSGSTSRGYQRACSSMMPDAGVSWDRHAAVPQLVVRTLRSSIFQSPSTFTTLTSTVCVQAWAPSGVTWHPDPSGAGVLPEFTDFTT